jgi:prophage regulatory protein
MPDLPTRTNSTARIRSLERDTSDRTHVRPGPVAASSAAAATEPVRAPTLKLLRFPVVRERTGLPRSTIWRLERRGEFPKHYRIAPNVVAWSEQEVSHWIEERLGAATS